MSQLTRETFVYRNETAAEAEDLVQEYKKKGANVIKYSITEKAIREKRVIVGYYYVATIVVDYSTDED